MPSSVSSILEELATTGKAFEKDEVGAKEALIEQSRALIAALEVPSEFVRRTFWAEPALSATIRLASNVKLFQHLRDASEAGLSGPVLAQRTGVDAVLLQRLARHLVAMHVIGYHDGAFHSTTLSNGLAAENYRHGIDFCYDVARPSFNNFPDFFKKTTYRSPTQGGTDGPFQDAHKTPLPFFEWLVATPPHLEQFGAFMTSYRAGKADWCDAGFYPVASRLLTGYDASASGSDVLLVDVGGGSGHDCAAFAASLSGPSPGRIILQDREPVIAGVLASTPAGSYQPRAFEAQAHDFFTPQPVRGARAYFLHSILHDWSDEDGVRILENLVPALERGYSRVLLNEIVVDEERPTLADTSMDMMMLAHFAVRERTLADWVGILQKGGLRIVQIYTYPGVAESLIEAELA